MQDRQNLFYYGDTSADGWHVFFFKMLGTRRGDEMRFRDVVTWCGEQFGPSDQSLGRIDTSRKWSFNVVRYSVNFRREEDAMFFKMRWC